MILSFIVIAFILAIIAPHLQRLIPRYSGWLLALLPATLSTLLILLVPDIMQGNIYRFYYEWIPALGINLSFYVDGLSILFLLLISVIGTFILIYSGGYLRGHKLLGRFYSFLLIFMAAMWGVVAADNLILMFVFWELTSISSYLLIGFNNNDDKSRQAALKALLVTGGGGLALLLGIILIGNVSGTYNLSDLLTKPGLFSSGTHYLPILLLVLMGAFTKSAQTPFHFWLPDAMAAPTPVSAFLHSATMVKAGIYLLARLSPVLGGTDEWHYIISLTGVVTMLTGALMAMAQTDLKRLLAYSTICALGTIVLLLGLNTVMATKAAVVFIIVHSLYKGGLFMVAGSIDHETGTRDVTWLGGLIRVMPVTAIAAGLAALSMSGFPPLLGFVGKELIYEAKLQLPSLSIMVTAAGILANMVNVAVAVIVGIAPFWDEHKITAEGAHEAPPALLLGPFILSLAGLIAGLYSGLLGDYIIEPAVSAVQAEQTQVVLKLWHGISPVFILSVVTLICGVILFFTRNYVRQLAGMMTGTAMVGPDRLYQQSLHFIMKFAHVFTRLIQNGYQRYYILIILVTTIICIGISYVGELSFLQNIQYFGDVQYYEIIISAVIIAASFAVIRSRSRLGGVAAMGVIGYSIALLFILYGAPDLAITQILVETLTVVLFVFAIFHLPRFSTLTSRVCRWRDAFISILFGGFMTIVVLKTVTIDHPNLSAFFGQNSFLKGFGKNVVNVILVDFRALDTLGEITVLSAAALGVYALIKLRSNGS